MGGHSKRQNIGLDAQVQIGSSSVFKPSAGVGVDWANSAKDGNGS